MTLFYCSECGKRFLGADMELGAMAYTAPAKCPICGGMRTRPWSALPAKIANRHYRDIWDMFDNK